MAKGKPLPNPWGELGKTNNLSEEQIEEKAASLLSELSLEEKIRQMSGDIPYIPGIIELGFAYNRRPYPAGKNPHLGIPGVRFSDGPRGIVIGHSTCFPVSMGRGASWDIDLEERIGDVIGVEARSQNINLFAGVCINLLRHPAWGRAQETYGEDSYLLGEMGAALIRGAQRHVMACVKHYAVNNLENTRFKVDVHLSERTLREVYLPHFKRCIDQGVTSVMSAYNRVNGEYCGHNAHLLRDILKTAWGFKGFVMSDFLWGVRDAEAAARAGLDLEMPLIMHYRNKLKSLVEAGTIPITLIDESVLRLLRQKIKHAQIGEPQRYNPESVACPSHRALAREAAQKSIVLLKNETVPKIGKKALPLDMKNLQHLAVIGKLAVATNTGDRGSSMVRPPSVITPLQGIRAAARKSLYISYDDGRKIDSAVDKAHQAEAAIVIAGYTHREEGEYFGWWKGGDRDILTLRQHDEELIRAISEANPHTIVVLIGGSAIITESWREQVPALLMAWYPGMEGGHAIADVLFGIINPSGKLPCSFPKSPSQLPFFDKKANTIQYDLYHGYRLMDKMGFEPAFPFGFGLSYTTYQYHDLRLSQEEIGDDGALQASILVTNTGKLPGEEIVQFYVGYEGSCVDRPVKELKGFQKVKLEPGETRQATFNITAEQLAYFHEEMSAFVVEPITYPILVGPSSRTEDLLCGQFSIKN